MPDNLDGSGSEHVVFLVGQRLRRRDDDRVTGMCAERVKVFHVAADDGVLEITVQQIIRAMNKSTHVGGISNDFILDLFPALQTLLNQDLRRKTQTLGGQVSEFLFIVRETGTETTEGKGRSDDDRVTDFCGSVESCLDGRNGDGMRCGDVDFCRKVISDSLRV